MPTEQKIAAVEEARRWYQESVGLIFADYRGLTVPEMQALRQSLRATGAEFHVVKNTLFRLVVGEGIAGLPGEMHSGPTATAFLFREQPTCAKVLVEFAKQHKALEIKGGLIEGRVLSGAEIQALAKLPSRHELLALIVGVVVAPIANVVGVMNEMIAGPIRVIGAIEEKSATGAPEAQQGEGASEPEAAQGLQEVASEPEAAEQLEEESEQKEGQE